MVKRQEKGGVVKKLCFELEKASLALTPSHKYSLICAHWNGTGKIYCLQRKINAAGNRNSF